MREPLTLEAPTTGGDVEAAPTTRAPSSAVVVLLVAAIAGALTAHFSLSRTLNINWDEWSYLSKVHTWLRGDPLGRLQTFHVHLFAPLVAVDSHAPDRELLEVVRLRTVSWGLLVVSTGAMVQLGRRLLGSLIAGLVAAFAALTFSFVLGHGTAARYDPFIVTSFLVTAVLAVEAQRQTSRVRALGLAGAAGIILAVGAAVSIKIGIHAPTLAVFLAVGVLRATDRPARRRAMLAGAMVFVITVVGWRALLAWHASVVPPVPPPSTLVTTPAAPSSTLPPPTTTERVLTTQLATIGEMMFAANGDGPQRKYLKMSERYDPGFWGLALLGGILGLVVVIGRGPGGLAHAPARWGVGLALACAMPLGTLLVYRNTYPYFFVSIIPPASLLAGVVVVVVEHGLVRRPWLRALVVLLLCVPAAITGARFFAFNGKDQLAAQRAVLAAVHEVFPDPVPYVDRCGMIASYPRVGPFMSSATMTAYRAKEGALVWPELLQRARPRFLLNNIASLDLEGGARSTTGRYRWQPGDYQLLQESFIPHWGPLWVAGRRLDVPPDGIAFRIHVADRYVVEAAVPVIIDDVSFSPGDVVDLAAGPHRASAATATTLTLRTSSAGPPPAVAPPEQLFTTFKPQGVPRRWWSKGRPTREAGEEDAP